MEGRYVCVRDSEIPENLKHDEDATLKQWLNSYQFWHLTAKSTAQSANPPTKVHAFSH
jgi:tRNA(His) 5'-end guanylyltransferase